MAEHVEIETTYDYIVIGGGIAGVTCVEHLHILDESREILLLTAGSFVKSVTNVVPLTKYLQMISVGELESDTFGKNVPNVLVKNEPVRRLLTKHNIVETEKGTSYKYKKLCICSGATPKVIDPSNPYVLGIRDTETVKEFQSRIQKAKRIVIVGNGGIATEMVYEIEGVEVIWAIKDSSPNAVFIDPGAAEFLKPMMYGEKQVDNKPKTRHIFCSENQKETSGKFCAEALGPDWHAGLVLKGLADRKVVLETEVEIEHIYKPDSFFSKFPTEKDSESWPVYVELTNGKHYGCDFIVSATGVTPNVSNFIEGNDFEVSEDGGLSVNEFMETNITDVYAAGDVCTAEWDIGQHWFQKRLWGQARQMGSYAAKCMWSSSSGEEIYMDFCFELFTHATKFFGKKVILLGLFNGQKLNNDYEVLLRMTRGEEYIKCILVDGKIQGAVLIGETDLEETFENLILNQLDISFLGQELLNPNVDIDDYFD